MSDDPQSSGYAEFGTWTSGGTSPRSKPLIIPAKAKPGYAYDLSVAHDNGPLALTAQYQVCTLNASKTSIRKGGIVRLSGVIPTEGHRGIDPGLSKRVIVYKRTASALLDRLTRQCQMLVFEAESDRVTARALPRGRPYSVHTRHKVR